MKRMIMFFISMSAAFCLLAGCQMEINPSLKISEIVTLCESKTKAPCNVDVVVKFEVSGGTAFAENKDKISELLSGYVTDLTNIRSESKDFTTYYVADAKIPLYSADQMPEDAQQKVCICAVKIKDEYRVGLFMGKNFLGSLNSRIPDNFYQSFKIKDLSFAFSIVNDSGKNLSVKTYSVYIDGDAAPFANEMSIEPNTANNIRLSEIYRDYIGQHGKGFFYEFRFDKPADVAVDKAGKKPDAVAK